MIISKPPEEHPGAVESLQASGRSSPEENDHGFDFSELDTGSASREPRRRGGFGLGLGIGTKMSYQPLSSKIPEERKGYGSADSSLTASPTALLIENVVLEDFERPQAANPFLDPETAEYWKKVYDGCDYECRHAFDPTLTWSKREEQELVRKLDWKVCLWAVRSILGTSLLREAMGTNSRVSFSVLCSLGYKSTVTI